MGGQDKASVHLDGVPALDRLLGDVPADVPVIVVGPPVRTTRPVTFCREQPRFAGPVAALAAASVHISTGLTAVIGVDQPRAVPVLRALVAEASEAQVSLIPVDASGRRQPLGMVVATKALRASLAQLGTVSGRSMRELLEAGLPVTDRPLDANQSALLRDFDTWADVASLQAAGNEAVASSEGADRR